MGDLRRSSEDDTEVIEVEVSWKNRPEDGPE